MVRQSAALRLFVKSLFSQLPRLFATARTKPKSVNGKDDTSSRRLIEWADGAQNHPRRSSPNR